MSDETKSASEQQKEDWMNSKWRPMMGWMYMVVCMMDMVVFPILWSLLQSLNGGQVTSQWNPLTLQGAGLFHIAMGAVLGIAAFGRTQEKMAGANNGGMQPVAQSVTTTFSAPAAPAPSFSSPPPVPASTSFTPSSSWGTTPVSTTASGKKIVPDTDQPAI